MKLRAGEMDRRIVLLKQDATFDSVGQLNGTWATVATVWAKYETLPGGAEAFQSDQRTQSQECVFSIRYLAGVDTTMRVSHAGQLYDIKAIDEVNRREGLRLVCRIHGEVA